MKTKNAETELEEFVIIGKLDPTNEYHLGEPILCKPQLAEENLKNDISKCKHINFSDIEAHPDNYSLLVLKFGGPDLKALCNKYLTKYLEKDKEQRVDNFWLEAHHLLKGVKFFRDNGIVHNDIKPQNILFNSTNGTMKYIDFGLMRTKKEVIKSSKADDNFLGIYHWSYPFDCGLMNKQQFNNYFHRKENRRIFWKNQLSELIVADSKVNSLNLPINNPSSFSILFTYLNPDNTIPNTATQYGYIDSFFDGFDEIIKTKSYDDILNDTTDSIDVFGLGFTLQFMANCFNRSNALSLEQFTRLSTFFHKMYDFNPLNRITDVDALLNEYENILLEIGVLTRLGKSFENNILVNKPPAPPAIMKQAKKDDTSASKSKSKSKSKHLSVELQEFANKDATEISTELLNKCPEGKELNPNTNRCNNECPEGYERNENFKCASSKNKKTKDARIVSPKICQEGKELNPNTNRCNNDCKPGFSRDSNFKCYSKKKRTRKLSSNSKSSSKSKTSKSKSSKKTKS
jgi:serine/threonine protein kinase